MTPPLPRDPELLLAQAGWIRSLARTLASDASRADDLAQSAWVAALEHPPGENVPVRRWLAAAMRNFFRQERRAEVRRAAREARVAREEMTPSASEQAESIAVQRALFEAVSRLDEPYRTTIFERYYEGLPPRAIARRHGLPVKTVKTRLSRGLEKLRADLDGRHGGRRDAWLSALSPLVRQPGLPAPSVGMLIMGTKLKFAGILVVLAAVVVVLALLSRTDLSRAGSPTAEQGLLGRSQTVASKESLAAAGDSGSPRLPVLDPEEPRPPTTIAVPLVRGRVVDLEERPMAGVEVMLGPERVMTLLLGPPDRSRASRVAVSEPDGTFEFEAPGQARELFAGDPELTTVYSAEVRPAVDQSQLLVVVAPRGGLAGVVVDESGNPLPFAQVEVQADWEYRWGLPARTDSWAEVTWACRTGASGRFEIPEAPLTSKAWIRAVAAGYAEGGQPAPECADLDLRIVLERSDRRVIRGRVVDGTGIPVADARVSLAYLHFEGGGASITSTRSGPDGTFVLEGSQREGNGALRDDLIALKPGYLPGRAAAPSGGWSSDATIVLDGTPYSIRGRVVDAQGRPRAGVRVLALDEESAGAGFADVLTYRTQYVGYARRTLEGLLRGDEAGSGILTQEDGTFVIEGLQPKSYRVGALDPRTFARTTLEPVEAGRTGVELVLPELGKIRRVAGRVSSRSGEPVAGVAVEPVLIADRWLHRGTASVTDGEGRFVLGDLAVDGIRLVCSAREIVPVWDVDPSSQSSPERLEIQVTRRFRAQVDLRDRASYADAFRAVGEDGTPKRMYGWSGNTETLLDEARIRKGLSEIVWIPEDAEAIVFTRNGGEEVSRFPLALGAEPLTVLRP